MKRSQRDGYKEEQIVLDLLKKFFSDLSETSNSGARFSNGDLASSNLYVEVKSTSKKSFSLKRELLNKIEKEAFSQSKIPLLSILFNKDKYPDNKDLYLVIPYDFLVELLCLVKEE